MIVHKLFFTGNDFQQCSRKIKSLQLQDIGGRIRSNLNISYKQYVPAFQVFHHTIA